jgi:hypothetical protein
MMKEAAMNQARCKICFHICSNSRLNTLLNIIVKFAKVSKLVLLTFEHGTTTSVPPKAFAIDIPSFVCSSRFDMLRLM